MTNNKDQNLNDLKFTLLFLWIDRTMNHFWHLCYTNSFLVYKATPQRHEWKVILSWSIRFLFFLISWFVEKWLLYILDLQFKAKAPWLAWTHAFIFIFHKDNLHKFIVTSTPNLSWYCFTSLPLQRLLGWIRSP